MERSVESPKTEPGVSTSEVATSEEVRSEQAVNTAEQELQDFLYEIDKINKEMVKRGRLPIVSEQEMKDIQMPTQRSGWMKYWKQRLILEIDILPQDVQKIIKKVAMKEKLKPEDASDLQHYVDKRTTVLQFNIEKRIEMARLKQRLQDIDKMADYHEKEMQGRQTVSYDTATQELFVRDGEENRRVTIGDVVADYEWGVKYRPDESVPRPFWRKIRKLADITEARRRLEDIFNNELSEMESISLATTNLPEELLEKNYDDHHYEGIIAERMVKNFLLRVQYNNPHLGVRVESSNAFEDTILKYDFKISLPETLRGVAIEGEDVRRETLVQRKQALGIQFTVSKRSYVLSYKRRQLEKARTQLGDDLNRRYIRKSVDDVVLVSLPLRTYRAHFRTWLEAGKPPGGPEQYLTREEKLKILKAVLMAGRKGDLTLDDAVFEKIKI